MSNLSKTFRYVNDNGDEITFEYEFGYLISKPVGIDTVSVSLATSQGIDQVGATVTSVNVQPREVNVSGIIVGDDQHQKKSRLLSVVRPDIGGKLYADDYYIEVRPVQTPAVDARPEFSKFAFQLTAPYPYWCRDESVEVKLVGIEYGFRLPLQQGWTQTYRFGTTTETEFFTINNSGQMPTPYTLTISAKAVVVNPKIENAETGQYILINKTMSAGERIVVELTHGKTNVTSSVDGDIRGALSIRSNLTRLGVGENILKPSAQSGKAYMEMSITYSTEIVGVTV